MQTTTWKKVFYAGILDDTDYRKFCHDPQGLKKTHSLVALRHSTGQSEAFVKLHEVVKEEAIPLAD